MSEEVKAPSAKETKLKQMQQAYTMECAKLGDIAYRIDCFEIEANKTRRSVRNLNKEASRLQREVEEEAANAKS